MGSYTTTADYKVYSENGKWYLEIVTPIYGEGVTATVKYPNISSGSTKINGQLIDPPTQSYTLNEDGWVAGTITNSGYKIKIAVHFIEGLRAVGTKDGKSYPLVVDLEYRVKSFNGTTWSDWSTPVPHRVSGIQKDAFTEVIEYNLPSEHANKRVEVAIRRRTFDFAEPKNEDKRYYYRCSVQTITAYQQATTENFILKDPPKPSDTRLARTALRVKATNQINGNLEGVNCIVQTVTKVWTGATPMGYSGQWAFVEDGTGIPVGTSNPAALFLYVLTHPGNPRRVEWDSDIIKYVDMEQIQRWYLYCEDVHFNSSNTTEDVSRKRGTVFRFNDVVGQQRGMYEVLRDICAAGRASPALINNKWTVVIDEPKDLIAQHFTPHNSWGFESTKILPRRPDAIKVQYYDEDSDYQQKELVIATPGFTEETAELFETISFAGVTNTSIARDHGHWHFAQAILRPEIYSLNTDIEYLVCNRGDRVKVTHDIPMWGTATGRIKNVISTTQLELDEEIEMLANKAYTIRIRSVDTSGNVLSQTRTLVKVPVDSYVTTVTIDIDPQGIDQERTPIYNVNPQDLFMIGELGNESHDLLVLSIEPANGAKSARLTLVDYASTIYTDYRTLTNLVFDPNITNLPPAQVESVGDAIPTVLFSKIRSDDRVMEKLSANNFIYGIEIPYINTIDIKDYPSVAFVEAEASIVENGVVSTPITVRVSFDSGTVIVKNVEEGRTYRLRLRYTTKSGNTGKWTNAIDHVVVGKTAPPANVTNLGNTISINKYSVYWDPCPNIDYDYTEIRLIRDDDPDYLTAGWDDITVTTPTREVIWRGKTSEVIADKPQVDYKYKLFVKHRDLAGIYSVTAATTELNIAAPDNVLNLLAVVKPTQLAISWTASVSIDYAATELRYVESADPAYAEPVWDNATLLWSGASTEYQWPRPPNGTYKILAKHKDLVGNYSIDFAVTETTITDLINAVSYDVEIESTNGTIFRLGLGTTTTLIAHVYENTVEVTDILPKYRFKWRRVSSDPVGDLIWNDLYAPNKLNNVGYKTIEISVDEVNASATFHCDILTDE